MKVNDVIKMLLEAHIMDEKRIFTYATVKSIVGGAIGSIRGLVLLSVYNDFLYIHRVKLDNSVDDCLARFNIHNLQNIKGSAGLFGGSFSFMVKGGKYSFILPSRANRFVDYFIKNYKG